MQELDKKGIAAYNMNLSIKKWRIGNIDSHFPIIKQIWKSSNPGPHNTFSLDWKMSMFLASLICCFQTHRTHWTNKHCTHKPCLTHYLYGPLLAGWWMPIRSQIHFSKWYEMPMISNSFGRTNPILLNCQTHLGQNQANISNTKMFAPLVLPRHNLPFTRCC